MDKREALEIAKYYIDVLSKKYLILQAFMFGSFAKGTNHSDSDIDIAIVIDYSSDIIETQIDMMRLRRNVDLRIEPHPFMKQDFNNDNPVANEILKTGVLIKNDLSS